MNVTQICQMSDKVEHLDICIGDTEHLLSFEWPHSSSFTSWKSQTLIVTFIDLRDKSDSALISEW